MTSLPDRPKILILEKDPAFAGLIKVFLQSFEYECQISYSPNQAKEVFGKDPISFHLLISQVAMPETNLVEFADQLKLMNPNLMVLFTSGERLVDAVQQYGLPNSPRHFIQTPFRRMELKQKIMDVLG